MDHGPTDADAVPAALYVRPQQVAVHGEYPNLHLERLLWSFNRDFRVKWSVSHGWPTIVAGAEQRGSLFAVAFVDEDAVPEKFKTRGLRAADLLADRIVWVERAQSPSAVIPIMGESALILDRPLSFDKFCVACAKMLAPSIAPFAGRFEYHTFDVLQDIWSEAEVAERETPAPLARYTLDAVLDAKRTEALVVTRRTPSYSLLYANGAFWDKIGWERGSTTGQSLAFLQGPQTQLDVLRGLHEALESEHMRDHSDGEWVGTLVNYTQQGQPFSNRLVVTPCTDASLFIGRVCVGEDAHANPAPASADPAPETVRQAPAAVAEPMDEVFAQAMERVLLDTSANVVITKAQPPFSIVHVNDAWCELCDFRPDEVCGKTLRTIQGPCTSDATVAENMARLLEQKTTVEMTLTNYKKGGVPFRNRVEVEPICDAHGEVRYMVGRLNEAADQSGLPAGPAAVLVD